MCLHSARVSQFQSVRRCYWTLDGKQLTIVDRLSYFGSYALSDFSMRMEVSLWISESRTLYAGGKHSWHCPDTFFEVERSCVLFGSVHGSLIWLRDPAFTCRYVRLKEELDHRCFPCIAMIGWIDRMSNVHFRNPLFMADCKNIRSKCINLSRLRWLSHALHMSSFQFAQISQR